MRRRLDPSPDGRGASGASNRVSGLWEDPRFGSPPFVDELEFEMANEHRLFLLITGVHRSSAPPSRRPAPVSETPEIPGWRLHIVEGAKPSGQELMLVESNF